MADTMIDVLNLPSVDSVTDGDTLLLVRSSDDGTQTAYKVDGTQFKGADGEAYNVENVTAEMKRNRLVLNF